MRVDSAVVFVLLLGSVACRSRGEAAAVEPDPSKKAAPVVATGAALPAATPAALGAPAPDFSLPDLDGKTVKLSDFKGKTVVLEWFNPDCPFVRAAHTKGSLVDTANRHQAKGVVWLAVNSGAPGKQGASREANVEGRERYGIKHPILFDEQGRVGKLYGAKRTPHLFVIAPDGKLVYRGAIDNSPDGEGETPKDGKLVNYVDAALAAVAAGTPVSTAETEAYGCSVKYGS